MAGEKNEVVFKLRVEGDAGNDARLKKLGEQSEAARRKAVEKTVRSNVEASQEAREGAREARAKVWQDKQADAARRAAAAEKEAAAANKAAAKEALAAQKLADREAAGARKLADKEAAAAKKEALASQRLAAKEAAAAEKEAIRESESVRRDASREAVANLRSQERGVKDIERALRKTTGAAVHFARSWALSGAMTGKSAEELLVTLAKVEAVSQSVFAVQSLAGGIGNLSKGINRGGGAYALKQAKNLGKLGLYGAAAAGGYYVGTKIAESLGWGQSPDLDEIAAQNAESESRRQRISDAMRTGRMERADIAAGAAARGRELAFDRAMRGTDSELASFAAKSRDQYNAGVAEYSGMGHGAERLERQYEKVVDLAEKRRAVEAEIFRRQTESAKQSLDAAERETGLRREQLQIEIRKAEQRQQGHEAGAIGYGALDVVGRAAAASALKAYKGGGDLTEEQIRLLGGIAPELAHEASLRRGERAGYGATGFDAARVEAQAAAAKRLETASAASPAVEGSRALLADIEDEKKAIIERIEMLRKKFEDTDEKLIAAFEKFAQFRDAKSELLSKSKETLLIANEQ